MLVASNQNDRRIDLAAIREVANGEVTSLRREEQAGWPRIRSRSLPRAGHDLQIVH